MSRLSLYLLGSPRVEIDRRPVQINRRKGFALLAYLAATGEIQRRDTLATLFWPESSQSRARGGLRRELSHLHQMLESDWLAIERETVALFQNENVWLDVQEFELALAGLETHEPASEEEPAWLERLTRAAALYRGDFLAGFTLSGCPEFDDWQYFQAERYRQLCASALEGLVDGNSRLGRYAAALPFVQRWLALDPLHETVHRRSIKLYALAGQYTTALRQYEACVRILNEELGVSPEAETVDLYEAVKQRRIVAPTEEQVEASGRQFAAAPSPALSATSASPSRSTPPLTSFVGREAEIEQILQLLLGPDCRLLTIIGAGGMGKTRLATTMAERVRAHYPDGVHFVALAGTSNAGFLAATLAETFGLTGQNSDPAGHKQRLLRFIASKHLLLVLDNFEHMLEDAGLLSELLQAAPQLQLLVTSRVRLNLQEEWLFPLQGLPYPQKDSSLDQTHYAAVELFHQRARKVRPDFSLHDEAAGIAELCRLVEGMPLAIELAANWAQIMACAEIAIEITRNLDLLSSSARNQPAQHHSMRAVFEQTWQLLSSTEQVVLSQLAIFRGFTREAAGIVTGATPQLLSRLVEYSLIRWQPSRRFDMHELLRHFAYEKLAANPQQSNDAHDRYCAYYAEQFQKMGGLIDMPQNSDSEEGQNELFLQLTVDIDNVRAAWRWVVQRRDAQAIQKMMNALYRYYGQMGGFDEGRRMFDEAIAAFAPDDLGVNEVSAGMIGSLLFRKAGLMRHDRHPEAHATLTQSLALLRQAAPANAANVALALIKLGTTCGSLGQNEQGISHIQEALTIFRARGHTLGMGYALLQQGLLEMGWGRLAAAASSLVAAAATFERQIEQQHILALHMLGNVYMLQGRYAQAEVLLQRAVAYHSQFQPVHDALAFALRNLGDLVTAMGDFARSEGYFAQATVHFERMGIAWNVALPLALGPGTVARLQGKLVEAERILQKSLDTARRVGFQQRIAINLHNLSRLRYDQERYQEAKTLLDEALQIARQIDFRFAIALVLCQRGHTAAALHQPEATQNYREALYLAQAEQIDRISLDTLCGIARQLAQQGEAERAVELLVLVQEHPAGEYETQQKAQHLELELAPQLSDMRLADAIARGRAAELQDVIAQLLHSDL